MRYLEMDPVFLYVVYVVTQGVWTLKLTSQGLSNAKHKHGSILAGIGFGALEVPLLVFIAYLLFL